MSSNEIAIGIVTALAVESAAIQAILDRPTAASANQDTNPYVLGSVPSRETTRAHQIVLATQAFDGTRSAASICSDLIRSYPGIRHVVMCGIAGGIPPAPHRAGVALGDIVSARDGVVDYDHVWAMSNGNVLRRPVDGLSRVLLAAERQLEAKEHLRDTLWTKKLQQTVRAHPGFRRPPASSDPRSTAGQRRAASLPHVHRGKVASADRLVQDPILRDRIADEHEVLAVEMEGSGIGVAADLHARQWYVVRGVADYCDERKNNEWHPYAALVAAVYTWALLGEIPPLTSQPSGTHDPGLNALLAITDELLDLEIADSEHGRRTLLRLLPRYLREQIPGHPEARLHILEIVRTCERYPDGRAALLSALQTLLGDYSPDYRNVKAIFDHHWPTR